MSDLETEKANSYLIRLKNCYNALSNSRVVKRRETDAEALQYFEKFCNETLETSATDAELKICIKNLYKCNPTSFLDCIANDVYLILLTEARAIVQHFGIRDIIYIRWDFENSCYIVEKNTKILNNNKFQKKIIKHKSQKDHEPAKPRPFYKHEAANESVWKKKDDPSASWGDRS